MERRCQANQKLKRIKLTCNRIGEEEDNYFPKILSFFILLFFYCHLTLNISNLILLLGKILFKASILENRSNFYHLFLYFYFKINKIKPN